MDDAVTLFSGGMDSLVAQALEPGVLLFVDYGQDAAERDHAFRAAAALDLELHEIMVGWPSGRLSGNALTDEAAPLDAVEVPDRNAWLVALASTWAQSRGCGAVTFGAIADDARDFPDCDPGYLVRLASLLGVELRLPLIECSKADVVAMARDRGLLGLAWSCYRATAGAPCGECLSCRARAEAER